MICNVPDASPLGRLSFSPGCQPWERRRTRSPFLRHTPPIFETFPPTQTRAHGLGYKKAALTGWR